MLECLQNAEIEAMDPPAPGDELVARLGGETNIIDSKRG